MSVEIRKGTCGLKDCTCGMVRRPIFTRRFVLENPDRAVALLNHAYYLQVENEKTIEQPK
jgi:hypothetical protein